MKKMLCALMLCAVMLGVVGCGEKEEVKTAKRDYSKRVEELQKHMLLSVGLRDRGK